MNTLRTFAIASIALMTQLTPAAAAVNDDIAKCRAALADHPELAGTNYTIKFERYREGRIRTVRFALMAQGNVVSVFCRIERGRVAELEFGKR